MGRFSLTLVALLVVGTSALFWWRCEGDPPAISAPDSLMLGRDSRLVEITLDDPDSGLRDLVVELRQGDGGPVKLAQRLFPGEIVRGGAVPRAPTTVELELDARGRGLKEGAATLVVSSRDWSWRSMLAGNEALLEIPVTVDLSAPRVLVATGLSYVSRGGAGAVVYSIDEGAVRDGVQVGTDFYPGFPFPGTALGEPRQERGGRRLALYAIDRDGPESPDFRVLAEDAAGNRTEVSWPVRFRDRSFEDVDIALSERFLAVKVAALADELRVEADSPLAAFQDINRRVRAENEKQIREVVAGSRGERHWRGAFRQMKNSAVTSRFAEHRTYRMAGEKVSEAIHYGYDLASTSGAPINASNAGRVLFAGPLGIYGNCVILDHGLGLASLYAHLAQIAVAESDPVEQGQALGRSGETGLAGGDHLHFAILVGGTYVDPKEWWDAKWVREKIEGQLE